MNVMEPRYLNATKTAAGRRRRRTLYHVLLFWLSAFIALPIAYGFPTEEHVKSQLHRGMTPEQVVAVLGETPQGRPETCDECTIHYLAPSGSLTKDEEGYIGCELKFVGGRLQQWRIMKGNPSFDPDYMKMPTAVKWFFWLLGSIIVLGIISGLIARFGSVATANYPDVLAAFASRQISADELPPEFRFITHETTLQQVVDRLGRYTRIVKLPVNPEAGLGYAFAITKSGVPTILVFEYVLPYRGAVVVMPEYPFAPGNRIRAVFHRRPEPETDTSP